MDKKTISRKFMKKKALTAGKCFCPTLNIWGLVSTTTTYELGSTMSFVGSYSFSKFKVISFN